jgi:hypothetical protein
MILPHNKIQTHLNLVIPKNEESPQVTRQRFVTLSEVEELLRPRICNLKIL